MALIPPVVMDSVVAIGIKNEKNELVWIGTGYIVGKPTETTPKKYYTFLVTNKHVIDGVTNFFVRMNTNSTEKAKDLPMTLVDVDQNPLSFGHPDPDIDVAIMPFSVDYLKTNNMTCGFIELDNHALTRRKMIEEGLSEGDFVYVFGFPMNLVGAERSYVIVRSGIIARIRAYLEGSSKDFLIDSSVFPGNSGGPVISKPEVVAIKETKPQSKAWFIGMVQSYIPYRDFAYSLQTKEVRSISIENSGLASVIPADFVIETVELAYSKFIKGA